MTINRPSIAFFIGFILGEFAVKKYFLHPSFFPLLFPLAVILICKFFGHKKLVPLCLFLAICTTGFVSGSYRLYSAHSLPPNHISFYTNTSKVKLKCRVDSIRRFSYRYTNAVVSSISIEGKHFAGRVSMGFYANAARELRKGDTITMIVRLKNFPTSNTPQTYSDYLLSQGIFKKGTVIEVLSREEAKSLLVQAANTVREKIGTFINKHSRQPYLGFIVSLTLGDRAGVVNRTNKVLKDCGMYHILSISGLHFAILGSVIWGFLNLIMFFVPDRALFIISRKIKPKTICALISVPCLFLFGSFVGWRSSTMRAFIMVSTYIMLEICEVVSTLTERVAFSGIILLFIFPDELFTAGFVLSYTIVFFIAATIETDFFARQGNTPSDFFLETAVVTAVISLVSIPFSAHYFLCFSLTSFVSNFLLLPVFSGATVLLFISVLLLFFSSTFAVFPFLVAEKLFKVMFQTLTILSNVPRVYTFPPPSWYLLYFSVVFYAFLKKMLGKTGSKAKAFQALVFIPALILPIFTFKAKPLSTVELFKKGKSDLAFLTSEGGKKLLIFNGREKNKHANVGRLVTYLLKHNISTIDYLAIPRFNMNQLMGIRKITTAFKVGSILAFGVGSEFERAVLRAKVDGVEEVQFLSLKAAQKKRLAEGISFHVLSGGNVAFVYDGGKGKVFTCYYGEFRRGAEILKTMDSAGVKIPRVFWKANLMKLLEAHKPEVIFFENSYSKYRVSWDEYNTEPVNLNTRSHEVWCARRDSNLRPTD